MSITAQMTGAEALSAAFGEHESLGAALGDDAGLFAFFAKGSNGTAVILTEVTLLASNWEGSESPYSQVVDIEGVTKNSKVDLQPSVEQLEIFHQKDLAFVTENEDGVVTVYAIGDKPANDYTIQATIMEVKA